MTTLRISRAPAVMTRPAPSWWRPAMAQAVARRREAMYQNGITAPSIRPPWAWPSWALSSGRASRILLMMKATENSTPTSTPTITVVTTSSALSMTTPWFLALLDDEATLVSLLLHCLAVLGSDHVGPGTQGTRTGGARAPDRGDGP